MELFIPPYPEWKAFVAVALSWIVAQSIKVSNNMIHHKRFNFRWLFDTGGMPSAHSSGVVAVATAVGIYYGFQSIIFLIAFIFALVTMFDAAGVRRAAGKQARILNKMTEDLYESGHIQEAQLKELLGHTPTEVFAGAFLGIIITIVICT